MLFVGDSHPTTGVSELDKSNVDCIHLNVVIHHLAQTFERYVCSARYSVIAHAEPLLCRIR